jgi:aspartate/methionine/tyrosine aminotransferase
MQNAQSTNGPRFANAMDRLGTESAFEVLARAKALEATGREVIHLQIGEPDFDTPGNIVEAGIKALRDGYTHYGPAHGLPELREAIAANSLQRRGIEHAPDQVLVTPGAKPVMFYIILALCQPGDEVIYPNPGFPIYESMIEFVGARPVPMPLLAKNNFRVDMERFAADLSDRTRLVILNSPGNPTGGAFTGEDMAALAGLLADRDVIILADEIYKDIIYDQEFHSITQYGDLARKTVILDGFSKSYAMTGWRLGYALGPRRLIDAMAQLQVNAVSCTAGFVQMAGVEALNGPQDSVYAMVEEFRARRDVVVELLNDIEGVHCPRPEGAFYAFPDFGPGAGELADRLLNEAGVAVLAGSAFGKFGSTGMRVSFANSRDNLRAALAKVKDLVESG